MKKNSHRVSMRFLVVSISSIRHHSPDSSIPIGSPFGKIYAVGKPALQNSDADGHEEIDKSTDEARYFEKLT